MSIRTQLRALKLRHRWRRRYRKRIEAVYVGEGVVLTRLASGRLIYVVGRDRSLAPALMAGGAWEHRISRLVSGLLKPGMTFLDVGANYGYFSLMAADLVGPTGSVIAVEANPRLAKLAAESLQINGHWQHTVVHNVAVDSRAGEIELRVLPELLGSSSFAATEAAAAAWLADVEPVTVRAATIDEIIDGRRLDVMKIDVEGAELRAFQGAQQTLKNNPHLKLVMEFNANMLGGPDAAAELLDLLASHGLRPYLIRSGGFVRRLRPDEVLELRNAYHTDLYLRAA